MDNIQAILVLVKAAGQLREAKNLSGDTLHNLKLIVQQAEEGHEFKHRVFTTDTVED